MKFSQPEPNRLVFDFRGPDGLASLMANHGGLDNDNQGLILHVIADSGQILTLWFDYDQAHLVADMIKMGLMQHHIETGEFESNDKIVSIEDLQNARNRKPS